MKGSNLMLSNSINYNFSPLNFVQHLKFEDLYHYEMCHTY